MQRTATASRQSWEIVPRAGSINVGRAERWASVLGGGALALYGLSRQTAGGWALALLGGSLLYRGVTGHCPVYGALGVNTTEQRHGPRIGVRAGEGIRVDETITVNRSPEDLYRVWSNFEDLPRFMRHLESVRVTGDRRSQWVARGPLGMCLEWDAELVTQKPNELLSWRSLPGSEVDTAGSIHFRLAPGNRGTEMRLELKYDPPGGKLGATIAHLFGRSAEQEIREDLRHFKQVMEAGEVPTTAGQPSGRSTARALSTPGRSGRFEGTESKDLVTEASEESFPASDAPAWTSGR